jgi:hypothetical protein
VKQIILDVTGAERFEWPGGGATTAVLVVSAATTIGFNYFLNWGIVLSTPLFMRVTTACAIPASFVLDIVLIGVTVNWIRIGGAVLVLVGFFMFSVVQHRDYPSLWSLVLRFVLSPLSYIAHSSVFQIESLSVCMAREEAHTEMDWSRTVSGDCRFVFLFA